MGVSRLSANGERSLKVILLSLKQLDRVVLFYLYA